MTTAVTDPTRVEVLERVTWETLLGNLTLLASTAGLCRVSLDGEDSQKADRWFRHWFGTSAPRDVESSTVGMILQTAMTEIDQYIAGCLKAFTVPLDLRGTPFQVSVWQAVLAIPYGETRTYRDIAAAIGRPAAIRAVGAANGANPLSIIVPCHRLVGADGTLRGYGGGLPVKAHLLELEGAAGWRHAGETMPG